MTSDSTNPISHHRSAINNMVSRLADALCVAHGIPQGDQLVSIFGDGVESCNLHAVETWVNHALAELDEDSAQAILPHLVQRLGNEIEQQERVIW